MALLDNSKAFAMLLVNFLHYLGESGNHGLCHVGSELVSMPLFSFISGMLSQSPPNRDRVRKYLTLLVLPAVLWRYTASLFLDPLGALKPSMFADNVQTMFSTRTIIIEQIPWYVIAIIFWRGFAFSVTAVFPQVVGGLLMLGVSLAGGYIEWRGPDFAVQNTAYYSLGFLAYFALGYLFPFEWAVKKVGDPSWAKRLLLGLVLPVVTLLATIYFVGPCVLRAHDAHHNYTHGADHCQLYDAPWEFPWLWTHRLAKVFFDLLVCLPLLMYGLPRSEFWWTYSGTYTLYVYLFARVSFEWRDMIFAAVFPEETGQQGIPAIKMCCTFASALFALLFFSSYPWRLLFSWLVEPAWADKILAAVVETPKPKRTGDGVNPEKSKEPDGEKKQASKEDANPVVSAHYKR